MADSRGAELVRFLAPGVLHGLGNSLFAVTSHAQMLGGSSMQIEREKAGILRAAEQAQACLEIVRFLLEEDAEQEPPQAGVLLSRLCEVLRVPCRDHGVVLDYRHSSHETPGQVDGRVLCRALAELVWGLVGRLPAGFEGRLGIDLASQRREGLLILATVTRSPALLPFPIDVERVARELQRSLMPLGVEVETQGERCLGMRLPAAEPRARV